jgi:iron complex outermembrane receptor protein
MPTSNQRVALRPARTQLTLALMSGAAVILVAGNASAGAAPTDPVVSVTAADSASAAATDQSGAASVGEVLVTARRVTEDIQKVPVAVAAIDAVQLRQQAVVNPIDIQFVAPSVQTLTTYGRLVGGYAIRGIANGTTTYFAEVPGGPSAVGSGSLYDLSSVQVLNGPQGTLFGRTNIAGAVLFEPTRPEYNHFNGSLDISEGGLGLNRGTMVLNIPVIEDQLAMRLDVNWDHLDGYTSVIGSPLKLNETNNYGWRFSLNWRSPDRKFTNYLVAQYFGANETSAGYVMAAYNPNIALFHLPSSINAPNGLAVGTQFFGAPCATAVAAGIQSDVNGCINQRLQLASTFLPMLQAEFARLQQGGASALRSTPALNAGLSPTESLNLYTVVNQTAYDFGKVGFTTLTVKNIFGVQMANGQAGWEIDGVGGNIFSALSSSRNAFWAYGVSANQVTVPGGQAKAITTPSPYVPLFTDELQVRGVVGDDLISWNLGGFYQDQGIPTNLGGITNIARSFGGVNLPTFGFTPSYSFLNGGDISEQAIYGQGTLNLSRFAPFLQGLHLTGGARYTTDSSNVGQVSVLTNVATGNLGPGVVQKPAVSNSSGMDTTISLDAQITHDLMVYLRTSTAYVPGGVNAVIAANGLPNFAPTYAPENVNDIEVGVKSDFNIGSAHARIDADYYHLNFTNIQTTFFGAVNGVTATYVGNAAGAQMDGVELQTQLAVGPFDFTGDYSYTNAKFTKWIGSDPLNLIKPGDPSCIPPLSPNFCLLNLANSAFPNIPTNQGRFSAQYWLPMQEKFGKAYLLASVYFQSRAYFNIQASRNIQAFAPSIGLQAAIDSQSQGAYSLLNLRAEWQNVFGSRFDIAAFINNATDQAYAISQVSVLQSLGTDVKLYGEPRTYGVELRYQFGS